MQSRLFPPTHCSDRSHWLAFRWRPGTASLVFSLELVRLTTPSSARDRRVSGPEPSCVWLVMASLQSIL